MILSVFYLIVIQVSFLLGSNATTCTMKEKDCNFNKYAKNSKITLQSISSIPLFPVFNGITSSSSILTQDLITNHEENINYIIYVIRRPGCEKSREQAYDLSQYLQNSEYATNTKVFGIVKEVAPVGKAKTDEQLGITEFQYHYFGGNPIYLDKGKKFLKILGNRTVMFQGLPSLNPFQIKTSMQSTINRIKSKNIIGNDAGNGQINGGLIIVNSKLGVIYTYYEMAGYELPVKEIDEVLSFAHQAVISSSSTSEPSEPVPVNSIPDVVMINNILNDVTEDIITEDNVKNTDISSMIPEVVDISNESMENNVEGNVVEMENSFSDQTMKEEIREEVREESHEQKDQVNEDIPPIIVDIVGKDDQVPSETEQESKSESEPVNTNINMKEEIDSNLFIEDHDHIVLESESELFTKETMEYHDTFESTVITEIVKVESPQISEEVEVVVTDMESVQREELLELNNQESNTLNNSEDYQQTSTSSSGSNNNINNNEEMKQSPQGRFVHETLQNEEYQERQVPVE